MNKNSNNKSSGISLMLKRFRLITSLFMLLVILVFCSFGLVSCLEMDEVNTNQDSEVSEPDIVKMTDDGHIIKLQPDGVTVTKVDKGELTLVKHSKFLDVVTPTDLIMYDKYLVAIVTFLDVYTHVSFYDLEDLNDGTNRLESIRETIFFGKYYTSRVFENELYILSVSNNTYYTYDEEKQAYIESGTKDSIYDSSEGTKYFTQLNDGKPSSSGYLMCRLNLTDITNNKYTLTSYLDSGISDLYFSRYAMYIVLHSYKSKGCSSIPEYSLVKINMITLKVDAKVGPYEGIVPNRYCLYDNGDNLFVVSAYDKSTLSVFNNSLKKVASLENLIYSSYMEAVYFDASNCYILSNNMTDSVFKVDITDALNPRILGFSNYSSSFGIMYEFTSGYFITVDGYTSGYHETTYRNITVSYYDGTENFLYLVNSIELDAGYTMAAANKKAAFISFENNFFAFASNKGAHILGIDEYGYLEQIAFLPFDTAQNWSFARVKLFDNYIYAIYAECIISYSLDNLAEVNFLSTVLE